LPNGSAKKASLRLMAGKTNGSAMSATPRAKLGDCLLNASDVEAEMMAAAIFQAVAKIRLGARFHGKLVAAAENPFASRLVVNRARGRHALTRRSLLQIGGVVESGCAGRGG
jgi:DNA-binding GntR family transcriptional regulator